MFIDEQTFSPSYNSAPTSLPPPSPVKQVVSLSQTSCVLPVELADERARGGGGAKSNYVEKAWSYINNSIFSETHPAFHAV
jgi:hypothetical protein